MRPTNRQLLKLTKPARYTGGEVNAVQKEVTPSMTRFAFCFPDVYEIGMSHLGLQILYFLLNKREDTYCERVFMPWLDMVDFMRETSNPLFALETGDELKKFDILGFTLQYEMSYTNILAMLDLAGIPLYSKDRDETHPIICAGGPCAVNPEPMADFVDFFYIGDGEASLDAVLDRYHANKLKGGIKLEFLESILDILGVYVPRFYDVFYNNDGTLAAFVPNNSKAPAVVKRAFSPSLDYFPETLITPLTESVHNRAVLELARGCMRGCRFCQAGYIYRPMRERGVGELLEQTKNLLAATGHDEVSLLSLSACDYNNFAELVDQLLEVTVQKRVSISLPSTRLDAIETLAKVQSVRKSSLTVAPEAGSQRMRDIINKNLTEEEILEGCYRAFLSGFDKIKLYFMAGLPGETSEDLEAVVKLCDSVVDTYYRLTYEERKRPVSVSVSTAYFVPKPFTPFQWAAQVRPEDFITGQQAVKNAICNKRVTYRYHDAKTAQVEGVLARGDRRVGQLVRTSYQLGAIFDGWSDQFDPSIWQEAFEQTGLTPEFYTHRERPTDEKLPWDFIDMGVTKKFLQQEWDKSKKGVTTPNCRDGCAGCGLGCKLEN
ncbi:MAG: TIGR03960 family B12-binding radical SAM protein [Firmicutes bacterium]|nr:TIGR03960 family B12-binding radical SAM protein [Bacillota bacterium]